MKSALTIAAAAFALAACGGPEEGRGGLTAEEERALDNAAAMLDENMFDTSPDSLVANETALETEVPVANDTAAPANGQ